MLLTVETFCDAVTSSLNNLVLQLKKETARNMTEAETSELRASYTAMSRMFSQVMMRNPEFSKVNIGTSDMLLEYKLPAASSWCDLILLGDNEQRQPSVIIIELKNWRKNSNDEPSDYEGLIMHNGTLQLHPSEQVRGYTEYCQRFHSAVVDERYRAKVNGLVFFSQDIDMTPYMEGANKSLTQQYPMYNTTEESTSEMSNAIYERIHYANEQFAKDFEKGYYKQDRNILKQVAESLSGAHQNNMSSLIQNPFVLLEKQSEGYNIVMSRLEQLQPDCKEVIIVKGPPGSGKSAIAVNVWIQAALKYGVDLQRGNVVFATTSSSQFENWNSLFRANADRGAGGMVMKASEYNPGINSGNVNNDILRIMRRRNEDRYVYVNSNGDDRLRKKYYKEYTDILIERGTRRYRDNLHFMTIVDEAHALINPMNPSYVQRKPMWIDVAGPQAYHIIRESQVSVFFMDDKQSFRDVETTSVDDIVTIARDLGIEPQIVSLEGMQFRCAGSSEYVDWVDALFTESPLLNHDLWKNDFSLTLVDYPSEAEQYLRNKLDEGESVRLLSSYTEKWVSNIKSKRLCFDHSLSDADKDFVLEDKNGNVWSKYWNNPEHYSIFVQGSRGTMRENPLSEVGCAYVVRGFDYDHVGILWLDDVVRRNGKWFFNINNCNETATDLSLANAKKEMIEKYVAMGYRKNNIPRIDLYPATDPDYPKCMEYFNTIAEAYRILFTRGVKSVVLYIRDEETRQFIKEILSMNDDDRI